MSRSDKYDFLREENRDNTQMRQGLFNNDNGAIRDREEVVFDRTSKGRYKREQHDYRTLKAAMELSGAPEEVDTRGKKSKILQVAKTPKGRVMQNYADIVTADQSYMNDPESILIEREKAAEHWEMDDLLQTLRQNESIKAVKLTREKLYSLVADLTSPRSELASTGIAKIERLCEMRIDAIEKERKARSLLKFNEKITKEVARDIRRACKINHNTNYDEIKEQLKRKRTGTRKLYNWINRLENLKIPGKSTLSDNLIARRDEQLVKVNKLVSAVNAKLAPHQEKQVKVRAEQRNQEELAGEMIQYLQEMAAAEQEAKPIQNQVRNRQGNVDWQTLNQLNTDSYEASFGLLVFFQELRKLDPDLMLHLYPEIARHKNKRLKGAYKESLKAFVQSHNSFEFSEKAMEECKRNNPPLYNLLMRALKNRPNEDRERAFHLSNLRSLPRKVVDSLYQPSN